MIIAVLVGLGMIVMPAASPATIDSNHRRPAAEPPYIHTSAFNKRFIYGAAHQEWSGRHHLFVWLYQWYGGGWHNVAQNDVEGDASNLRAISYVYCGEPYKKYWFYTYSSSWTLTPYGWQYDGSDASRAVELGC
ncbi:hypothetical protein ACFQ36_20595 [Arthrobacter sp. GCM10027362]|uniref:hypothetical protein n=1 Tax=Arthrobacter sp. GCM10027362 TaxID=3273379 RepID=UPI003645F264